MNLYERALTVWPLLLSMMLASTNYGSAAADAPQGFISLFNGKDLTGWKGLVADPKSRLAMTEEQLANAQREADQQIRAHWKIVEGVLEYDGKGTSLCTTRDYGDFELYVDWKILPRGDSGIFLRGSPQIQIWDTGYEPFHANGADKGSGGLWNNQRNPRFPLVNADKPAGEWNTFTIRLVGNRVTVRLNGQLVTENVIMENYWEPSRPLSPRGQIELQHHGNKIWFRNIYLREIEPEEANRLLAEESAAQFVSVFNGRNLDGWDSAVDGYHVSDGALLCKEGQGGTLFTSKQFSNFIARLEFKLPPKGNNGLAIRYPGYGSAHTDGMCELQILSEDYPDIDELDPRQLHGSAYGLAAAHQGYLRPVGEWNFSR